MPLVINLFRVIFGTFDGQTLTYIVGKIFIASYAFPPIFLSILLFYRRKLPGIIILVLSFALVIVSTKYPSVGWWPFLNLPIYSLIITTLALSFLSKSKFIIFFAWLAMLIFSSFMVGFFGYEDAIGTTTYLNSIEQKVDFANNYAHFHIFPTYQLQDPVTSYRFERNLIGFYNLGFGSCFEMALIEHLLLNQSGVESRIVLIVGEDHTIVEVKINGTWMISDPGLQNILIPREEFTKKRLNQIGGISLVYVVDTDPPIFITDQYVPTDLVTIKITKNSLPYSNCTVTLMHYFNYSNFETPKIHPNSEGIIKIKLGDMRNYIIGGVEPFYWVCIDGNKTEYQVTSNGTYNDQQPLIIQIS